MNMLELINGLLKDFIASDSEKSLEYKALVYLRLPRVLALHPFNQGDLRTASHGATNKSQGPAKF